MAVYRGVEVGVLFALSGVSEFKYRYDLSDTIAWERLVNAQAQPGLETDNPNLSMCKKQK